MFERWKASYENGDLNDRKILREALAYQNYLGSPRHIQSEVEKVIMVDGCDDLLNIGMYPNMAQCCLGTEVQFEGEVAYFVLKKKTLLPKPAPYANQNPDFLQDTVLNLRRKVLFISDWTDEANELVLHSPDQVNCGELARGLGLCGTNWKEGERITIMAFNVEKVHKTTWLDSGLVFFWYAAPHQLKCGLARNLETGLPTLREWVLPKQDGAFMIMDYWDREAEQDYDLSANNLGVDYWNACAKEIRQ
ncbi:hypothetical protein [Ferrovum myxofaciens]|uniref:hypothetical protein n=1 Tax=Ferrovum myxofaciens TaxID=416213 RepID=UPI0004E1275F|nr:hypothetical protein [Ferrovum myxofaciens]